MRKLGFVGCGTMGKRMALNVIRAGYPLVVYDIDPAPIEQLVAAGATEAGSPREVAEQSEVILTSLPYPSDVEQVICGPDGILDGAKKGLTIIDTSTIDPKTARKLAKRVAEKEIHLLHAPLSGGPDGAAAGTLTVMVGGERKIYDECKEILNAIGRRLFYIGEDAGLAAAVKLCHNIMGEMEMIAMAETVVFGIKLGLAPETIFEVLNTIRGGDWTLEHKYPYPGVVSHYPANRDFEPQFFNDLMAKDMGLVTQTAKEMKLPLLMTTLAHQMCEATSAIGLGRKDFSAVAILIRRLAGESQGGSLPMLMPAGRRWVLLLITSTLCACSGAGSAWLFGTLLSLYPNQGLVFEPKLYVLAGEFAAALVTFLVGAVIAFIQLFMLFIQSFRGERL